MNVAANDFNDPDGPYYRDPFWDAGEVAIVTSAGEASSLASAVQKVCACKASLTALSTFTVYANASNSTTNFTCVPTGFLEEADDIVKGFSNAATVIYCAAAVLALALVAILWRNGDIDEVYQVGVIMFPFVVLGVSLANCASARTGLVYDSPTTSYSSTRGCLDSGPDGMFGYADNNSGRSIVWIVCACALATIVGIFMVFAACVLPQDDSSGCIDQLRRKIENILLVAPRHSLVGRCTFTFG